MQASENSNLDNSSLGPPQVDEPNIFTIYQSRIIPSEQALLMSLPKPPANFSGKRSAINFEAMWKSASF
jgi:hypothetical protein